MAYRPDSSDGVASGEFALHCRGDVRLFCGGADCTPTSKKGRALLAVLAAEQRPLTRTKIIDLLWSDRQEEQARASLRTLLADLKGQFDSRFDELLVVDRERIALGDQVRTDLTDPALARPAGELFEGLDHIDPELDEWLRVEREKWQVTPALASAVPAAERRDWARWPVAFAFLVAVTVGTLMYSNSSVGTDQSERVEDTETDDRLNSVRALLDKGNPTDALRARTILIAYVQQRPEDATAWGYLAEATMSASNHGTFGGTIPLQDARREARAYGNRAIKLDPKNAAGWAALGWSRFATADGVAPFERAVALDSNNSRYRTQLGRALEYQNRYDEAYLNQLRAMELDPLSPIPLVGLMRAAVQLNRVDEMKRALAAFERRRPRPNDLAYAKGYLAFQLGDEPACIRHLQPVVARGDRRLVSTLISCLTALGEIERAASIDASPSLRSDVLRRDVEAVERRALRMGGDFWLRNTETLAAADLMVSAGRARALVASFDANYDSVAAFAEQGGRIALEPMSLLLAMQAVGRRKEAAELRTVLVKQALGWKEGMKLDTWSLFLRASVALLDGQRDRAVSLLERCFPDCFAADYQADISETALFGRLKDHGGFRALVAQYRQQLNKRRGEAGLDPLPLSV